MTFYPTTLLPPYRDLDDLMLSLTDACLIIAEDDQYSVLDREQYFHLTMTLVDFWMAELESLNLL